jgi:hypothetical protein
VFGVIGHRDRLVDKKHGDAVLDAIRAPQAGVVQELIVNKKQRSAVFWAYQDAEQLFVEHETG